ncbi:MAG TPA: hypothetical protein VIF38_13820 [Burkholderiales bacterium]|jgi:hypothetical protein
MKILMRDFFAIFTAVILMSPPAFAQLTPVKGLAFKLGDDIQTVKNALKTDLDPEPLENAAPSPFVNMNAGKTALFLRTRGIHVFFGKKGVVESIKLEPPFAGSIDGVNLGDSEKRVHELKGKPIKTPWQFGASRAFLYALDDSAYVRFDINENEGVQAIYIQK